MASNPISTDTKLAADKPVFRFAPSPNGELHLGHAYSALLNHDLARRERGRMLLRIEDIDTARCTPEFEAGIFRDLEWLGIEWERPVRRQSEHFADYAAALERLKAMDLIYPAFMSRGDVRAWIAEYEQAGRRWPRDPDGAPHYPPLDRNLPDTGRMGRIASSQPFAWRLKMDAAIAFATSNTPTPNPAPQGGRGFGDRAAALPSPLWGGVGGEGQFSWMEFDPESGQTTAIKAEPERWGDVIVARSDTPTSYNMAVVLDDALQGVTHVVRGKDLFHATSVHRLLQRLIGLPEPIYHHHKLILGLDGRKLAKSESSRGLAALRAAGATPDDIRRMVGLQGEQES